MIFTKMFNVGVASEWVIGFSGVDRLTKSTLGQDRRPLSIINYTIIGRYF